jgi:hypothetical protein
MDKAELISSIRRDRAALEALVSSLGEARLTTRESDAGWSVKDHLSHVAAWERMIIAHLRDGSDADVAGMDAAAYATPTLDELNDLIYHRSRDRGVAETLREFREAHRAIVSFIAEMPEERLATLYWDDDPSARQVLDKIAGDTYLHYREHAGWISELAGRTAEAR